MVCGCWALGVGCWVLGARCVCGSTYTPFMGSVAVFRRAQSPVSAMCPVVWPRRRCLMVHGLTWGVGGLSLLGCVCTTRWFVGMRESTHHFLLPLFPVHLRCSALSVMAQVREFSAESAFHDPCLTYVLHDVMCSNCNATRDVDLARDTVRVQREEGRALPSVMFLCLCPVLLAPLPPPPLSTPLHPSPPLSSSSVHPSPAPPSTPLQPLPPPLHSPPSTPPSPSLHPL